MEVPESYLLIGNLICLLLKSWQVIMRRENIFPGALTLSREISGTPVLPIFFNTWSGGDSVLLTTKSSQLQHGAHHLSLKPHLAMSVVNYSAANEATRVRRLATDTDVPAKATLSCKSRRAGAPCPLYYLPLLLKLSVTHFLTQ